METVAGVHVILPKWIHNEYSEIFIRNYDGKPFWVTNAANSKMGAGDGHPGDNGKRPPSGGGKSRGMGGGPKM